MKQVKKLLVVLPLVLVFVLGSLPVFALWPTGNVFVTVNTVDKNDTGNKVILTQEYEVPIADFKEADHRSGIGYDPAKIMKTILGFSTFKDDYNSGKLEYADKADNSNFADFVAELPGTSAPTIGVSTKKLVINLIEVPEEKPVLQKIVAVDRLTLARVPATIHELENKDNAKSVYDMAHEFFDWETAHGNALKDYYFLGFAPDVNNQVTDLEQEQLDEYEAGVLVWVVEKLQPLNVTHVFPDRAPLFEKIAVDYWVLEKGQINNANAAEFAKTRIQKMNEQGYVFEKAEYTPYIYRESIMKEALDVYGKKIQVDSVVSTHGIFVYYKGAVVPAPVADGEKKVDAASVQTGVQANVQAPVAAAGAQPQQLPATGVADNAFLFLSSAALMALGIFFFKKH